jgi:hypothetical protein
LLIKKSFTENSYNILSKNIIMKKNRFELASTQDEEVASIVLSNDLAYTSATNLAVLIRQRDLSPVEVVNEFIDRIEARNPSLNALVYLGFDDARRAAKAAEVAVMHGEELGPLHGVPTAIKDLFDFKPGWPATLGGIRALKITSLILIVLTPSVWSVLEPSF